MARKKKNESSEQEPRLLKKPASLRRKTSKTYAESGITPKILLYKFVNDALMAVKDDHDINDMVSKFNNAQTKFVKDLSLLATGNKFDDIFGDDFNIFFNTVIKAINLAGRMHEMLLDNGIEPPNCDLDDLDDFERQQ